MNNGNLRTLSDLRGLQGALTGALEVAQNAQLRNLDGLQSALSLGKDANGVSVKISDNAALEDTSGLSGISKVEGSIVIMLNPSLAVLAGLQKIADVPADMTGNSLIVQSNQALTNLLGFSGIGEVSGAISIERECAQSPPWNSAPSTPTKAPCSQKRSSQSRGNSQPPKPTVSALT